MVEFGDELVLESLRIPWLIWIQLLVMLLLLLLLYSFTSSNAASSAAADSAAAAAAPPPPPSSASALAVAATAAAASSGIARISVPQAAAPRPRGGAHQLQVRESQSVKGFIATSASRGVAGEEDTMEGENSSPSYMDHHPCSIVRLARIAFLKCFGLDFTSEDSSFKRHRR
ncbi:hypothetical protein NL676_014009 [Syzygium grande]|nr:hypothetical protein NL676_014009 [Syzygium grande]